MNEAHCRLATIDYREACEGLLHAVFSQLAYSIAERIGSSATGSRLPGSSTVR
jgi:hypothetical protein